MGNHSVNRRNASSDSKPQGKGGRGLIIAIVIVCIAIIGIVAFFTLLPQNEAQNPEPAASTPATEEPEETVEEEVSAGPVMSPQMQQAQQAVESIVASRGDAVAVCVLPVDGGAGFSINGSESFVSASMIKLAILAKYMHEVDAGAIGPADQYTLKSSDIVGGSGIVQNSSPGTAFTYDRLAEDMIKYSDNTATNILLDTLGMDAVNSYARGLGLSGTKVNRLMMHTESGLENYVTADECAQVLLGIAQGTLASREACNKAEAWLLAQDDRAGLIQGLPSGVGFGHKTGSLATVRHDGGIVYGEDPYVIVVLTRLDESTANSLMAEVSRAVYGALEN